MNEDGFRTFLKKQRRSEGTIAQCIRLCREFDSFLGEHRNRIALDAAQLEDLHAFITWKKGQHKSVNSYLWALYRYYDYTSNTPMLKLAANLRQSEIELKRGKRKSLKLKDIQDISEDQLKKLAEIGITDVEGILTNGQTRAEREVLAIRGHLSLEEVLKLVKIADLTRIVDIKGIRVRLLYETGIDTIEKLSTCDPEKLHEKLITVNSEKHILKRHPTKNEAKYWVTQAKQLEKLVEY